MTRAEKKADKAAEKQARKVARATEAARKAAEKQGRKTDKQDRKQAEIDDSARRSVEKRDRRQAVRVERAAARSDGSDLVVRPRVSRLFKQFSGSRKPYAVGMILLAIEAATAVVALYPVAFLIDFLISSEPTVRELGGPEILRSERDETIVVLIVAVVVIAVINSAARSLGELCMTRAGRSLGYGIRTAMFERLQRLPQSHRDSRHTGDVVRRITRDVRVVEDFVSTSVRTTAGSVLLLVAGLAFVAFLYWPLAVAIVLVVPLVAFLSRRHVLRLKAATAARRSSEGELESTAQEILRSIRLMQTHGGDSVDLGRFSEQAATSMRASTDEASRHGRFGIASALIEAMAISAVVALGVWLVDRQEVTIGTLVLVVLLLQIMFRATRRIVAARSDTATVHDSIGRIGELLVRQVPVAQLAYAVEAPDLQGHVTFRNVAFTYPADHVVDTHDAERPAVLQDVDFEVLPGQVVALAGSSGAGKSTIAQLMLRLYDPDAGEVLIDGMPLRSMTVSSIRGQVSLVSQDTVILPGSVAENIAFGIDDPAPVDIEAAASLADAHTFITNLPHGYETNIGERGATLTDAQCQLIAIARAFMRHAPILILDEPTAGLDTESTKVVVDALATLVRDTTTIMISKDPGLTELSDRVLVVADGRVTESTSRPRDVPPTDDSAPVVAATPKRRRAKAHPPSSAKKGAAPAAPPTPAASRAPLLESLHRQLPGLVKALDPSFVADQVDQQLLGADTTVEGVEVGGAWLRADGTCSVDYHVRLAHAGGDSSERFLLGRVMPDDDGASTYVHALAQHLSDPRTGVSAPWREASAIAPGSGLALHPFPIDPELPTLVSAMDPSTVLGLVEPAGLDELPVAELVRHPNEGACVVRYRFRSVDQGSPLGVDLFGRVYGDDRGDAVADALRALMVGPDGQDVVSSLRFPRPIVYSASLRLLITEALPGKALVPALLESNLVDVSPRARKANEARAEELRDAVRASAEALAMLHTSNVPASVRSIPDDLDDLHQELDIVGQWWPEVAADLRGRVDSVHWTTPEPPRPVLSHGNFTPSNVLIDGGVAAMDDLDALGWADPALDIGTFLTHLEVIATTVGGTDARPLVNDLSQTFLDTYRGAAPDTDGIVDRVDSYRALTLVRTAVRACRRADDQRLEVSLSLLDALGREHSGG